MLAWKKLTGIALLFLLIAFVAFGIAPASAQAPVATTTATTTAVNSNTVVTATATLTPTATTVPVSATKTLVPPTATKTKTVAPSATATKTQVPPTATVTKTVAPSVTATKPAATATATKTATVAPTKTKTPVPPTATSVPKAVAPRAGVVTSLSTSFEAQNTDSSTTANLTATFYDTAGNAVNAVNKTAAPLCGVTIDQRFAGGGLDAFSTWQGSVVLSSNTPLAAVVNQYGGSSASGTDFRMDSYTGSSSNEASSLILMPQVVKNFVSYNSTIAIQNTSSNVAANVTITYTNILVNPPAQSVRTGITIPPGASVFIDMASEVPGWSSSFGPAYLSSDQNVVVIVNRNKPGALITYKGFTSANAGTTLIVPQAMTNFSSLIWGSAIEGMTVNGGSSSYTVSYTNLLNGSKKTCSLPNDVIFRIDFRLGNWPSSCTPPVDSNNQFFGQVVITGTTPLVALVNQITGNSTNGVRTTTTPAFPSDGGTTTGFAPLIMNNYLDPGTNVTWGTALEGRMAGSGTVQINYCLATGQVYTDTYTVGTDYIFRFDQRNANSQTGFTLPSGSKGSARITAPFPILFKVNVTAGASVLGDPYGSYTGVNQ